MYCIHCGSQNDNNEPICNQCKSKQGTTSIVGKPTKKQVNPLIQLVVVIALVLFLAPRVIEYYQNTGGPIQSDLLVTPESSEPMEEENTSTGFIHPESINSVVFDDGSELEFFIDSAPVLCYILNDYTDIQLQNFYNTYADQYIFFTGTVSGVSGDGNVMVQCLDEAATEELELLWPMQAVVDVKTNASDETLLGLYDGLEIAIIAPIQEDCYSSTFGVPLLSLENGIILAY